MWPGLPGKRQFGLLFVPLRGVSDTLLWRSDCPHTQAGGGGAQACTFSLFSRLPFSRSAERLILPQTLLPALPPSGLARGQGGWLTEPWSCLAPV